MDKISYVVIEIGMVSGNYRVIFCLVSLVAFVCLDSTLPALSRT